MGKQWLIFIFGGSKITADGDYNHEIKKRLLLGREIMTNLDSILKGRDITLSTKVSLLCLEGVPDLPVAPQDEAGLTKTFQTWPRGWFHIP